MDCARTGLSLPDEVLVALSHFLHYNITKTATLAPENCEKKSHRKYYPIDTDSDNPKSIDIYKRRSKSIDRRFPMQRNTKKQEDPDCSCSTNEPARKQSSPSEVQGKLSPSCSKSKNSSGCKSSQCSNNTPHHQERPPVYPCQDQVPSQQIKRPCPIQAPLNRSQQFQQKSCRSQSVPRPYPTERYSATDRYNGQGPRGLHAGQESTYPSRGCCGARNQFEGDAPTQNTSPYVPDKNSKNYFSGNWNNSSQVGTNYGELQRRQQQLLRQQQQQQLLRQQQQQQQARQQQQTHHRQLQCPVRQQQCNECNMTTLEDGEISGFDPDSNSTMLDEEKRCNNSTKSRPQPPMPTQSWETPQMPRRAAQCGYSQMQHRNTQYESPQMPRRKPQQYETLINETSYLNLPEAIRPNSYQNRSQNTQTMYQDNTRKQCQMSHRSRSLSPYNFSKYKSQQATCYGNNTNMDMDDNEADFYPEDTNCCRSPHCSTVSRAMLQRSCLNETSLDKTNKCWAGRSARTYTKTPEDYLAERTQGEFMEALVKDRGCPGFIQSTLNGNENFNEFAFDIAFPGPIPAKPFPVDPITLVEAIKLRIDYEREEIRRSYRPITTENIDSHFFDKNKTEVNEAVAAFLKAESQYQVNREPDTFEAHINGLDTNMFDESIKMNVYTATTKPGQETLDLSYH